MEKIIKEEFVTEEDKHEGIELMRELGKKFKEEFVTTEEDMLYFFSLYCKLHKEELNQVWDIKKYNWPLDKQDLHFINDFIDNFCNDLQTDLGHHYTLYAFFLQGVTGLEIKKNYPDVQQLLRMFCRK